MYFAVKENVVVAGKSVFGYYNWKFVTFVHENRSPAKNFRCYRPFQCSSCKSNSVLYNSIRVDFVPVIYVESKKIKWWVECFNIIP